MYRISSSLCRTGIWPSPGKSKGRGKGKWLRCRRGGSLQDLIAIWFPHMSILAVFIIVACMVYDPTMKMLLYTALPEKYKNRLSFGICILAELRFLIIITGLAVPTLQRQIVAFQDLDQALQALVNPAAET